MIILKMDGKKTVRRGKVQEYKPDWESEGIYGNPWLENIFLCNCDTGCKIHQMDMNYSHATRKD